MGLKEAVAGTLICATGYFMMTFFDETTELWYILLSLFVMGVGLGTALVSVTNLAFKYIHKDEDGQLSGITNTYRQVGISIGVATLNATFMTSVIATAATLPEILVPGFKHAFFVAVVIVMAGFIVAMTLKDKQEPQAGNEVFE